MNIMGDPRERFTVFCFSKNFQGVVCDLLKGQKPKPESLEQAFVLMEYFRLITAAEVPDDVDAWEDLSKDLLEKAKLKIAATANDPFWRPL